MKRVLLLFIAFLSSIITYGQAGLGPIQNCTQAIPEICNASLYPAATSGVATSSGANFSCYIRRKYRKCCGEWVHTAWAEACFP